MRHSWCNEWNHCSMHGTEEAAQHVDKAAGCAVHNATAHLPRSIFCLYSCSDSEPHKISSKRLQGGPAQQMGVRLVYRQQPTPASPAGCTVWQH